MCVDCLIRVIKQLETAEEMPEVLEVQEDGRGIRGWALDRGDQFRIGIRVSLTPPANRHETPDSSVPHAPAMRVGKWWVPIGGASVEFPDPGVWPWLVTTPAALKNKKRMKAVVNYCFKATTEHFRHPRDCPGIKPFKPCIKTGMLN
jgi:hypothetical protein